MTTAQVLNADQLNAIAKQSGYTGGKFSSVGLPVATPPTSTAGVNPLPSVNMPTNTPTLGNTSNASAMNSGMDAQIQAQTKFFEDQMKLAKEQADALQKQQEQNKSFLQNLVSNTPSTAQTRANAYQDIGIDPAQYFADQKSKMAEIDTLNQEYSALKAQAEQQKASLLGQGRGITTDFLNNQAAQIDRNAAPKLNMLSANINSKAAVLQALQGNFNEARSFVNQAVEDSTADLKFKFDTATTFYNMNEDAISRLDTKYQNALSGYLDSTKTAYENARADKQTIGELMVANPGAGITMNDSIDEAYAKYTANPLRNTDVIKLDNGNTVLIDTQTGQIIKNLGGATGVGGGTSVPSEYTGLVSSFGNLFGTKDARTNAMNGLSRALSSNDFVGAYATIANGVEESLTGENKTKFGAARTDYSVMLGLRDAISQYANAGGDTGLLRGTAEEIERKLGQVTNPALATLATQLKREFQSYRVNMTGAAFGAGESRDYDSVNPSSKKSLDLNYAVIQGALNQLENRITSTVESRFPASKQIYEKIAPSKSTLPGISTQDEDIFNSVVSNSTPTTSGGFFSNIWKGLTGK